ncbi:hypothetical protein ACTEP5_000909 [Cronobacter sakazakii]|nr:hypothetical protein [Cronobacter sakazakii]EMA8631505.1 hypothetical protein [Cronobacter sakazakii]
MTKVLAVVFPLFIIGHTGQTYCLHQPRDSATCHSDANATGIVVFFVHALYFHFQLDVMSLA